MPTSRRITLFLVALLAIAAGVGAWLTRAGEQGASGRRPSAMATRVDQQPLQLAQQLEAAATTREESRFSRQALEVADHETDLAFTTALRDARAHPPAPTPETNAIRARIAQAQALISTDEAAINQLSSQKKLTDADLNALQLAEAEFILHTNERDDAKRDLARSGADPETRIQRQFQQHQAAMHSNQAQAAAPYAAKPDFQVPHTLYEQVRTWFSLQGKSKQLVAAQALNTGLASGLAARHDALERQLAGKPETQSAADASAQIAAVERRSDDQKTLSEYDQRIQDLQELSQIYVSWQGVVQTQMSACLHGALKGVMVVLIVVLIALVGMMAVDRMALRFTTDRRRAATMRLLGRFGVQAAAVVVMVLLVVGPPNQLSTILALAGAGLTVALKDFIVAFLGWFVLMGKNGVRVGDWVEINGIVGEVTEIGLLRTTVLETGNWAGSGHPTGRRVTVVNSFAIEGHYFNFSTSGQWLWDTLEIVVPAGVDPNEVMERVLDTVRKETATTARRAEDEWKQAARGLVMRGFTAEPTVELRPAALGYVLVVHYMSSASLRFETRGRLYHAVFELLHRGTESRSATAAQA
ncbi:MAG: mechanosensitive ion channel domain-containing protein [Terriglobales bacterium]